MLAVQGGLDQVLIERIRSEMARLAPLDDAAKLGLTPGASAEEVKRAFDRRASDLEPHHFRGHGPEVTKAASELLNLYREAATRLGGLGSNPPEPRAPVSTPPGPFQSAPILPLGDAVRSADPAMLRARAEEAEKRLAELHFHGLQVVASYRTERARADAAEARAEHMRARAEAAEQLALKQRHKINELVQRLQYLEAQLGLPRTAG